MRKNIQLISTSPSIIQPKAQISSLLITPTIRKSIGSHFYDSIGSQTQTQNTVNEISGSQMLDEQNRIKECLAKNFQDKLLNLEKSKLQTKSIIEGLKLNLNDIELMTANNIFKITSIKS